MNSAPCPRPELQALVARYELGALEPAERAAFEQHVLECDACVLELERGVRMAEALREGRSGFAALLQEEPPAAAVTAASRSTVSVPAPRVQRRLAGLVPLFRPRLLVPAAAALLIGLGLWQEARRSDIRRWASFPPQIAASGGMRSSTPGDAVAELLDAGASYFDLGQHAEAQRYFRAALEREPDSVPAAYGLGLVLAVGGDLQGAIPLLERAAPRAEGEQRDAVQWVLANAYLARGEREAARRVLALLVASSGAYAPRAQDLDRRLRP